MTQESSTREKDQAFLFANARFGGNDKAYNERKKESNQKQGRDEEDTSQEVPPKEQKLQEDNPIPQTGSMGREEDSGREE